MIDGMSGLCPRNIRRTPLVLVAALAIAGGLGSGCGAPRGLATQQSTPVDPHPAAVRLLEPDDLDGPDRPASASNPDQPVGETQQQPQQSPIFRSPTFGYELTLPSGWRRSEALSLPRLDGGSPLGMDMFTRRDQADERAQLQRGQALPWPGPAWVFTVTVVVWSDPTRMSPLEWVNSRQSGWSRDQIVESARLAGRPAVRLTHDVRFSVAYFVGHDDRMYQIGMRFDAPDTMQPAGYSRADLDAIVASLRFTVP